MSQPHATPTPRHEHAPSIPLVAPNSSACSSSSSLAQLRYLRHLRVTKAHNETFRKMSQKIKQIARNHNCPSLIPLSGSEQQSIIDAVQSSRPLSPASDIGQEMDDGPIEYKWKLLSPGNDRLQHLMTQMTYRLGEGKGTAVYHLGVSDAGSPLGLSDTQLISTVSTVFLIAKQLNKHISIQSIQQGVNGKVACVSITPPLSPLLSSTSNASSIPLLNTSATPVDGIRVCVTGHEGVGKSTLIGVLTGGTLDDGRGAARMRVFRHRHELFDGRTSSISQHLLGFDRNGVITNYRGCYVRGAASYSDIVEGSAKLVTFVDHPGHERYFGTSVQGLTARKPHYVMWTVSLDELQSNHKSTDNGSNDWAKLLSVNLDGLLDSCSSQDESSSDTSSPRPTHITSKHNDDAIHIKHNKEEKQQEQQEEDEEEEECMSENKVEYERYLTLCQSVNAPLFIVISKSDLDKRHGYALLPRMLDTIRAIVLRKSHNKLKTKLIESGSEAQRAARALSSSTHTHIPIIIASSVNGEGLDLLKTFLFSLNSSLPPPQTDIPTTAFEFGVDDIFSIAAAGIVVSGIVRSGQACVGDTVLCGPDRKSNTYRRLVIASMHVRRKDVARVVRGQMASLCLTGLKSKSEVRRGMVLVDESCDVESMTCYSFEAELDVLNQCVLRENSQPIIHIESIRQSAHILFLDLAVDGDKHGKAVFTFLHHAEFVRVGMKVIIRKSHGPIAVGRVSKVLDKVGAPLVPLNSLQKPKRLRMSRSRFRHYLMKWKLDGNGKESTSESSVSEEVDGGVEAESALTRCRMAGGKGERVRKKVRKKKKTFTLVWRSGLAFENFYPDL